MQKKIRRKEFEEYDSAYSSISDHWMNAYLAVKLPRFWQNIEAVCKHLWKRKPIRLNNQREQNGEEPRAFLTLGTIHLVAAYLAMPLACIPSDCDAEQHQNHLSSKPWWTSCSEDREMPHTAAGSYLPLLKLSPLLHTKTWRALHWGILGLFSKNFVILCWYK